MAIPAQNSLPPPPPHTPHTNPRTHPHTCAFSYRVFEILDLEMERRAVCLLTISFTTLFSNLPRLQRSPRTQCLPCSWIHGCRGDPRFRFTATRTHDHVHAQIAPRGATRARSPPRDPPKHTCTKCDPLSCSNCWRPSTERIESCRHTRAYPSVHRSLVHVCIHTRTKSLCACTQWLKEDQLPSFHLRTTPPPPHTCEHTCTHIWSP